MPSMLVIRYKRIGSSDVLFQQWYTTITEATTEAEGFLDMTDLPPIANEKFHHVFLRFITPENANAWLNSSKRLALFKESEHLLVSDREEELHHNTQLWFKPNPQRSIKWKQWTVTFLAVYPLTILLPFLINYFFPDIPFVVKGLLSGLSISGTMVYFMMPFMLKIFNNWLNPNK